MTSLELAKEFIGRSPGFYEDLALEDLDCKHASIIEDAYNQIGEADLHNRFDYRTWSRQSDLSVPAQISKKSIVENGFFYTVARYLYRKLACAKANKLLVQALMDDIGMLVDVGGEKYMLENPVHLTPNARDYYFLKNTSVNLRWLRYLYLLVQIEKKELLSDGDVWVDIGSYYGGLQGLIRKYQPSTRMVLVDFHHQLCRSYVYLKKQYKDSVHIFPDELHRFSGIKDFPRGAFIYIPVTSYKEIANETADLVTNFFSLGEMKREFFTEYMKSVLFVNSKNVYLVNRFVSAPFFEPTYDTDLNILDYDVQGRDVVYFDIFPMHHFMLRQSTFHGMPGIRNVSSPYFEMITKVSA